MAILRFVSYNGIETSSDVIPTEIVNSYSSPYQINVSSYCSDPDNLTIGEFLTKFCNSFKYADCDTTDSSATYKSITQIGVNNNGRHFVNLFNGDIIVSATDNGVTCFATITPGYGAAYGTPSFGTSGFCDCYPYNNHISLTCTYNNHNANDEIIAIGSNLQSIKDINRISINDGELVMNVDYDEKQAAIKEAITPNSSVETAQFYFKDGDTCTAITDSMFADTKLYEINFPRSVKEIGVGAFSGCTMLTNYYPSTYIEASQNQGYEIVNNITYYEDYCFSGCTNLLEEHFRNGTNVNIGVGSFSYCESLKEVDLYGVVTVGESAFTHCSSLEKITNHQTIPIPDNCYSYCPSLKVSSFTNSSASGYGDYCFSHSFDSSITSLRFVGRTFGTGMLSNINATNLNSIMILTEASGYNTKVLKEGAFSGISTNSSFSAIVYSNINSRGKVRVKEYSFANSNINTIKFGIYGPQGYQGGGFELGNYVFSGDNMLQFIDLTNLQMPSNITSGQVENYFAISAHTFSSIGTQPSVIVLYSSNHTIKQAVSQYFVSVDGNILQKITIIENQV